MGNHRFTDLIFSIMVTRNSDESTNLSEPVYDLIPIDFTPSSSVQGFVPVYDNKRSEYTLLGSAYGRGIHSDFIVDFKYYSSRNSVLLLDSTILYYNNPSPPSLHNSANLMIHVHFDASHKLTGTFTISHSNKPGLILISEYTNPHADSTYYSIDQTSSVKGTISQTNDYELNVNYNFELTRTTNNSLTLKIIKDDIDIAVYTLDSTNKSKIGFMANMNIIISDIKMFQT